MLRILALLAFLIGGAIGYEEYTGDEIGVKASIRALGSFVADFTGRSGGATPGFGGTGALGG